MGGGGGRGGIEGCRQINLHRVANHLTGGDSQLPTVVFCLVSFRFVSFSILLFC